MMNRRKEQQGEICMSIEKSKALARRFHSCVLDGFADLMSADFVGHDIVGHTWDRDFQIAGLAADIASFEDLHDTIHDIVAEGDKVFVRFTRSGKFKTRYEDFEPTNQEVEFPVMEMIRISDDKIVEIWDYNDDGQVIRILRGEEPKT